MDGEHPEESHDGRLSIAARILPPVIGLSLPPMIGLMFTTKITWV